ncbi:MAG: tetratricopeptide repeat protein [Geminicoccaceae bacterium]|nr:tetratricopeptide repeat protein [Geminicoccaceae bacterium]
MSARTRAVWLALALLLPASPGEAADPAWVEGLEAGAEAARAGDLAAASDELAAARALAGKGGPPNGDPRYWTLLEDLGQVLAWTGQAPAALAPLQEALRLREAALPADDPDLAGARLALARIEAGAGAKNAAHGLAQAALAGLEAGLGADHPATAPARFLLADLALDAGDSTTARRLAEAAFLTRTSRLGADHPATVESAAQVARIEAAAGDAAAARARLEALLPLLDSLPPTARAAVTLPLARLRAGENDGAAERLLEGLFDGIGDEPAAPGEVPAPLLKAQAANEAGVLLTEAGAYDRALPWLERGLDLKARALGKDGPALAPPLLNLAELRLRQGEPEAADGPIARAERILQDARLAESPAFAPVLELRASQRAQEGRFREAVLALEGAMTLRDPADPALPLDLEAYATLLDALARFEDADRARERLRGLRGKE